MFTGLVAEKGTVKAVRPAGRGLLASIDIGSLAASTNPGDSVAVNGVCLTATKLEGQVADFDISGETVRRSTLSKLKTGARVNLELAMAADGRFGGHIVQGHVDGTAVLKAVENMGDFYDVTFAADKSLTKNMIEKGSVSVNGISLTIAKMNENSFTISVIPVTWKETTLSEMKIGDAVNIETDLIVKVISRQLENMLGESGGESGLSIDKLRNLGF